MNAQRKKEAIAILENELEYHRAEADKMSKDLELKMYDPVKDVRIKEGKDYIVLTYDGAGYDYFSYYSCLEQPRQRILAKMSKAGFLVEDRNNWSLTIRDERC